MIGVLSWVGMLMCSLLSMSCRTVCGRNNDNNTNNNKTSN